MDRTAVSGTAGTGSIPVGGAMFTANTLTTYSTRSVCVSPFGSVCRSQNKRGCVSPLGSSALRLCGGRFEGGVIGVTSVSPLEGVAFGTYADMFMRKDL